MNDSLRHWFPTKSNDDVVLLTLDQACARTQLSRPSVVRLIKDGRLRAIKVGTTWRISAASIESLTDFASGDES